MTLSVFLRNPAKCRGPKASPLDFSASKSRAFRGYARQMQAFAERVGLRPHSLQGASLCILRRCCHPAPGSKQEAMLLTAWLPALRGWCTVVRSGVAGVGGTGVFKECGAHEHQRASAAEAVQRIVEIVVVRLITSDGRRSCRRCDYVQRLQQIAKLNRGSCQLLPDD